MKLVPSRRGPCGKRCGAGERDKPCPHTLPEQAILAERDCEITRPPAHPCEAPDKRGPKPIDGSLWPTMPAMHPTSVAQRRPAQGGSIVATVGEIWRSGGVHAHRLCHAHAHQATKSGLMYIQSRGHLPRATLLTARRRQRGAHEHTDGVHGHGIGGPSQRRRPGRERLRGPTPRSRPREDCALEERQNMHKQNAPSTKGGLR